MPNCLSCGRQAPPSDDPQPICPDCRAAIIARAQSQNAFPGRSAVVAQQMPLTLAIVALNVLVFALMVLSGVSPGVPEPPQLIRWGADFGPLTLTTQPWRILTSNYIHIGALHILLNMWCLWNLGALAERIFDRWTYFLTYTACGLAGSIVSLWRHPMSIGAGASGAIFGMAGALISALYLARLPVHPSALKATLKSLLSFAGYNLFFGTVVPGIDNSAHLGGFVTGLLLGAVLARHLTSTADDKTAWRNWVFLAAGVLLFLGFHMVRRSALRGL
ncbi:MAG TPA: rhomboid family intramembrane serine protease [Terriglobales bacterium]|nr:rhomboid family intramembrane serine protease [Terriglobales bacterium]